MSPTPLVVFGNPAHDGSLATYRTLGVLASNVRYGKEPSRVNASSIILNENARGIIAKE